MKCIFTWWTILGKEIESNLFKIAAHILLSKLKCLKGIISLNSWKSFSLLRTHNRRTIYTIQDAINHVQILDGNVNFSHYQYQCKRWKYTFVIIVGCLTLTVGLRGNSAAYDRSFTVELKYLLRSNGASKICVGI